MLLRQLLLLSQICFWKFTFAYCLLSETRQLLSLSQSCFKQLLPENLTAKFHYYLCQFASTFHFTRFLLKKGYGTCAIQKEQSLLLSLSGLKQLLEKALLVNSISPHFKLLTHFVFPQFLLIEDCGKCALRKELVIAAFVELV